MFSRQFAKNIGQDFAPKFIQKPHDLFFFISYSAYLTFFRAEVFFSGMGRML